MSIGELLPVFGTVSCSVGRAFRHIRVINTKLMHYLSSVCILNQPLHVSGMEKAYRSSK